MLVALDYDGTYTLDPLLWDKVIGLFHTRGHEVICVTMRYPSEGAEVESSIGMKCKIIFTERNAKKSHLRKLSIYPDVWIDDTVEWILMDASG